MINTSKLTAIKEAQEGQAPVQLSDLVLIGNILKSGEIDTTVVADYNTYIEVNGLINTVNFLGRYVVVGREIVKITSVTQLTTTSKIFVERGQLGTLNSYAIKDDGIDFEINPNYSFRTVTIFDRVNTFDINSNTGNTSDIFSFQVESSTITIDIDSTELKDWISIDSLHKNAVRVLHDSIGSDLSEDIERIDIRKDKGMVKFVFIDDYIGIQLDGATGKLLHIESRRSDFIENIHDGSILDYIFDTKKEQFKLAFTTLTGLSLFAFTFTGFWLWYGPRRMRKK